MKINNKILSGCFYQIDCKGLSGVTLPLRNMFCFFRLCVILIPVVIACGVQFDDQYENVEKLRSLAVTFDNNGYAEAGPGDTVTVRAYFGGDVVQSVYWSMSTQLLSGTFFGPDTFVDSVPIEPFMIPGTHKNYFGNRTDSVVFDFKIPDSIIRNQFDLSMPVTSLIPASIDNSFSLFLNTFTIGQILDLLDTLTQHPELISASYLTTLLGSELSLTQAEIEQNITLLLQMFSVEIRIFAVANNSYKLKTSFTVRNNSKLKRKGINVEVNRLPEIENVSLYKIKGKKNTFHPVTNASEITSTYTLGPNDDTVFIEKGYSYFIVADIAKSVVDTGYDFISGAPMEELFYYKWFFSNDVALPGVEKDALMKLPGITYDSSVVQMLPSLDKRMTSFTLWLCVYDDMFGGRFRPRGFAFKAMHGVFSYPDDY